LSPRARFWVASLLCLWLALWVRLADLYSQPVFVDEANHLAWSQKFARGDPTYPLLLDGKFLLGPVLAWFQPAGPAPLWIGRAAIGLMASFSVAACLAGGALLGSRRAGALAGLVYALLPQAVAQERQVLADPLMAAFGSLAIVFTLQLARARRPFRPLLALGAALAAAFSAKLFGGLYLLFPLLAAVWFRQAKRQLGALALAALITLLFLGALYGRWGQNDQRLVGQRVGYVGCPPLVCRGDFAEQSANLGRALRSLGDLVPPYLGLALMGLAAAALGGHAARRRVAFLAVGAAGMVLAFLPFASDIPPRYVAFAAAPLAILGARGLLSVSRRSLAGAGLLALLALWPAANTALIVLRPAHAWLPALDRQRFENGALAIGLHQAALDILANEAGAERPPVVLVRNLHFNSAAAYFDRTRIDVRQVGEAFPADLGGWLLAGQHVYLVEEFPPGDLRPPTPGMIVEEAGRFPSTPPLIVRLGRVTGAKDETLAAIFRQAFIDPQKLIVDYRALAESLPADDPVTLLAYPPHQVETLAPLLSGRPNLALHALGDSWPVTISAGDEARLRDALAINAIFLEETRGDPERKLETWLNTELFRLDEQWFGPIRLVRFAGRLGPGQETLAGVDFGEAITLESIQVFDPAVAAGGVLRLRYVWRARAAVEQQFKVFTHLFAEAGIVAQHDGQPVGELRPTTTWQAGEAIVDQFAVRLPPDIQPGAYQLRVGLYDIITQARLPVVSADGQAANGEFYVGGQVVVTK
jgi:hypothetical protein